MSLIFITLLIAVRLTVRTDSPENSEITRMITVDRVVDGDTIKGQDGERIRLLAVDAPEIAHHEQKAQPYGAESADWLSQRLRQKKVTLKIHRDSPTDTYGRTLAWVYLNDTLINQEILATGNARLLDRFGLPPDREPALRHAEATARVKKLGLWKNTVRSSAISQ